MAKQIHFLLVFLLFGLSHSVVITGTVVDSISSSPISDVTLSFRLGENPDRYPKALTDSNGSFRADVAIPQYPYPLQFLIEKTGYCSKKIDVVVRGSEPCETGRLAMVKYAESAIVFTGVVKDSVSGNTLAGARINLVKLPEYKTFLTFTTDSAGNFRQLVTISNSGKVIWGIQAEGYYTGGGQIIAAMDGISQTIRCTPVSLRRLVVKGVVVDSLTREPVEHAMVIAQTTYHNVEKDSSYTDENGLFTRSIMMGEASSDMPSVWYEIIADGYAVRFGYVRIPAQPPLDLGTIALLSTGIATHVFQGNSMKTTRSVNYRTFSVNGRMLSKSSEAVRPKGRGLPTASQMLFTASSPDKAAGVAKTGRRSDVK